MPNSSRKTIFTTISIDKETATVFFGKMKRIIIILERINHKKHLFGVETIKADLPKYAKN